MAEVALTAEQKTTARWIEEINIAESALATWYRSGDVIVRRYKNEDRNGKGNAQATLIKNRRFAILWSNVQTIGPAIYSQRPSPVVSRRFKDPDPVAKVASEVLERALTYTLEAYPFDERMTLVRNDYLLPGRGVMWVRYVPHIRSLEAEAESPQDEADELPEGPGPDGSLAHEAAEGEKEEVYYEEVVCDHVYWKDFLTNPARNEAEIRWKARIVLMSREQLVKRFGEKIGNEVSLDWAPQGYTEDMKDQDKDKAIRRARVYEIWDITSKRVYWISKAHPEPLDEKEDPLRLQGFFPCPPALNATQGPDSIIPVPDYVMYQDQAEELDELTQRIGRLQDALRMVGFYAGENQVPLQRAFAPGNENKLIPVDSFDIFKEKGGVKGLIEWIPVDMVAQVLAACYEARQGVLQDIYQITGISDIIRGDSNPNETATAQRIKGQWGSLRIRDRQKDVQRFARDAIRIKAEIIAEHFSIETLKQMTGIKLLTAAEKQMVERTAKMGEMGIPVPPPPPEMMELMEQPTWEEVSALLKDDALRSFRIEVETDSTIEADDAAQKQALVEGVGAITQAMQAAAGIIPAAPYVAPLWGEIIKEVARTFRMPRTLEDTIDRIFSQAEQMPPQVQGQPQTDPAQQEAEQMKGQVAVMQAQNEQQRTQMEGQLGAAELQLKGQELAVKAAALARDPEPQGIA